MGKRASLHVVRKDRPRRSLSLVRFLANVLNVGFLDGEMSSLHLAGVRTVLELALGVI
jgi:hypothetical protein